VRLRIARPAARVADLKKRGYDMSLLKEVVRMLESGIPLDEKHHDHQLTADFAGSRECHIRPDWLLIYKYSNEFVILYLVRTGTHSDLFK
jgi:mRNA interferase YafQ